MGAIVTKAIHCVAGVTIITEDKFLAIGALPMVFPFKSIEHKSLFLFL